MRYTLRIVGAITNGPAKTSQLVKNQEIKVIDGARPLDFVFVAKNSKPFRVREIENEYWICWLHPDKRWVTLRKVVNSIELWYLQNRCIDWKHSHLYEFGLSFKPEGWPRQDLNQ